VKSQILARVLAGIVLLVMLLCGDIVHAQESLAGPQQSPSAPVPLQQKTKMNVTTPCVQPPPMVSLQDYNGPLEKTVGLFARKLELKAAHPPHYQPGVVLCSLDLKDKFFLFVRDTFDPITFLGAGFDAGLDQAENRDPGFGQGAAGYGKCFGASFAFKPHSNSSKTLRIPRYSPRIALLPSHPRQQQETPLACSKPCVRSSP